ncbi:hypothetical protein [Streptomyces salinarius]|uniref:hypothetical protein n=1 Tax=Streptomyces salinarius TaxID=2762598 RepID=UPI0013DAB093|nr:hypothetical protein [Streptomyces salinarius]
MLISVLPVRGKRMMDTFLKFPIRLHRRDSNWVAPLTSDLRSFVSPERNPYLREAEAEHFIARDSRGRTVGRVTASIDPAHVQRFGRHGYFGWFETVDDQAVARALLDTAARWVGERGMTRLTGPHSYCSTQEFGMLVAGHGTRPAAFQPHNPQYYADLLTSAGLQIDFRMDTYSWHTDRNHGQLNRLVSRGEAMIARHGLRVRSLDPARWDQEIDLIHELMSASFNANHDMVPMSRKVLGFQTDQIKQFLDPRLTRFVELDGRAVGFSMLMADANEVLAATNGRAGPTFLLRYPFLKRRVHGAVVLMIGVRPEVDGLGIGRVLAGEIGRVGLGGIPPYRAVHTTWVHEHNWQSRAYMALSGARPARSYAIYGKALVS